MSLFELREAIESAIPWWIPLVMFPLGFLALAVALRRLEK